MISLYPSHIPISFTYPPVLPYPYISHIHVLIFLSVPPVALSPVFFIFHFCGVGNGGVFFLWFFGVGVVDVFRPFLVSFVVPSFAPFRPSVRFSSRPSVRFHRFAPCLAFRPVPSFRFSVLACRVGGLCGVPFYSALLDRAGVCSFSCFGVVAAMWEACIVDGGGSADGVAGRLCWAYGVPCGLAWGVSLGEVLGGVWWRLRDMGMMRRMAGRCGREG